MSGDAFTRDIFGWLDRVAADGNVSPLAFKLAYVINQHINRRTGTAWPSQQTLAAALGVTCRAVRKLTRELAPHLTVSSGRGRTTSVYQRILLDRNDGSSQTGTTVPLREERNGRERGTVVPPELTEEPIERTNAAIAAPPDRKQEPPEPIQGGNSNPAPPTPDADLFRRGKQVLGNSAGGLIRKLLSAKNNNVALARAAIEQASTKQDPREYVGRIVAGASEQDREERRARLMRG
jgi:hypothetical protein